MSEYGGNINLANDPTFQKMIKVRPLNNKYIADVILPPVELSQAGGIIEYELNNEDLPDENDALMTSRNEGQSFDKLQMPISYGTKDWKRTARILYTDIKESVSNPNCKYTELDRQNQALGDVKEWFARLREKQVHSIVTSNFTTTASDKRTVVASAQWDTTPTSAAQIIKDIITLIKFGKEYFGYYPKKAFCSEAVGQVAQYALGQKVTLETFEKMLLTDDLEDAYASFKAFGLKVESGTATYRTAGARKYSPIWAENYFYVINSDPKPRVNFSYPTFGWTGRYYDKRSTDGWLVVPKPSGLNWEADVVTNWGHVVVDQWQCLRLTGPKSGDDVTDLVSITTPSE